MILPALGNRWIGRAWVIAMDKTLKLQWIRETGLIAILRSDSTDHFLEIADAIHHGGVKVIEVSMNTPGALQAIERLTAYFGSNALIGAGTALDSETARQAILSGASFVVAPIMKVETIELCRKYDIPILPGCLTPTEILTAWEAGADMVKVFPAELGGANYICAIHEPLPQIALVPVGGVDLNNTAEYIRAGAVAVGVGGNLMNRALQKSMDLHELTKLAASYIAEVNKGRQLSN